MARPVASTSNLTSAKAPTSNTAAVAPAKLPVKAAAAAEETHEDRMKRARAANDRFKRRGKRPAAAIAEPEAEDKTGSSTAKKAKPDDIAKADGDAKDGKPEEEDEYLKQVKQYSKSMKDEGSGKRPLIK